MTHLTPYVHASRLKNMAQEDTNVIDQPEVLRHKMVTHRDLRQEVRSAGRHHGHQGPVVHGPRSRARSRLPGRVLRCLRDLLSHQRRSQGADLSGLPDGGARRHVLHHDAAVSGSEGHSTTFRRSKIRNRISSISIPKRRSAEIAMPARKPARRRSMCAKASGRPCSAISRASPRCSWTA